MSTQETFGIEFSVRPEAQQQHFRLLELPPELLDLLTSDDAPKLQLKSQEPDASQTSDSTAVLCTPDKTYNLRQVNTSNSLFVTQTTSGSQHDIPKPGLEAVAQTNFTLELSKAVNVSVAQHLRAILPVYTSTGHYQSNAHVSKSTVFTNIPASDGECEKAWMELACFELRGEALVPSPEVKLVAWSGLLTVATSSCIDLTGLLDEAQQSKITEDESEFPTEVQTAVLRSMALPDVAGGLQLDEMTCCRTVGLTLLQSRQTMAKSSFFPDWANLLPEKWRSDAELSLIDGHYKLDNGQIVLNDEANGFDSASGGAKAPSEAKPTLGAKRKWHEKFREAKRKA